MGSMGLVDLHRTDAIVGCLQVSRATPFTFDFVLSLVSS